MSGSRLIAHGTPGGGTWMQLRCRRCGACLSAGPDRHEQRETAWAAWAYIWECRVCGELFERTGRQPPSYWSAGPVEGEPGTFPPWGRCRLDRGLIVKIRDTADRLVDTGDPAAIRGRESLLDHEGRHPAPWGELTGDAADPTGVRHALAYLRHGRLRRLGTRNFASWAEIATLATALIYERTPEMLDVLRKRGIDIPFPEPVDVGPIIGWGEESLSGRYARRAKSERDAGIRGGRLLKDLAMIYTADLVSDYESDLERFAVSARRWAQRVAADQP